jgi:hypothetical protein
VKRSLVGVRSILSILGGPIGLSGLSVASTKVAQAARTLRPPPSILIVGLTAAGKTTVFQYLCHTSRSDQPARTGGQQQTGRLAAGFSGPHRSWFRSKITDDGLGRHTHE